MSEGSQVSKVTHIVSQFECGSQSISDLEGRYRAARAAKNLGEIFGNRPINMNEDTGVVFHRALTTEPPIRADFIDRNIHT